MKDSSGRSKASLVSMSFVDSPNRMFQSTSDDINRAGGIVNHLPFSIVTVLVSAAGIFAQGTQQNSATRKPNTNYAVCHVYVLDTEQAEKLMNEVFALVDDPKPGQIKALQDKYPNAERILGKFEAELAEEVLTTQSYALPGTEYVVTASVFPTDEQISTKSGTRDSINIAVVVAKARVRNAINAENNASAQVTFADEEQKFQVKTYTRIDGRLLIVGLECEFGENSSNTPRGR